MKNLKKIWVAILVIVLALAMFAACDKDNQPDGDNSGNGGGSGELSYFDYDLSEIFAKYEDFEDWNFKVQFDFYVYEMSVPNSSAIFGYKDGTNISYTYKSGNEERTDYYSVYSVYYEDNGNDTYTKYDSEDVDFGTKTQSIESQLIYIDRLNDLEFKHFDVQSAPNDSNEKFNQYYVTDPQKMGGKVFSTDLVPDITWNRVELHLEGENISQIVATGSVAYDDNGTPATCDYKIELKFSDFGNVDFDIDTLSIWDARTLRSQMKTWLSSNPEYNQALPLQSIGDYHYLVVPVQFTDKDKFTSAELNKLEKAFNGTPEETGWQSVKSYYKTSSYGKLDMTFDIQKTFTATNSSTYYENYSKDIVCGGETIPKTGADLLFEQVIAWLAPTIDLTVYDNDGDGVLDGIWMIYSTDIDYDGNFYWAYVTQYMIPDDDETKYDGLVLGSYLFAGLDFMDEYTGNSNDPYLGAEYDATISGLKINASTYIHETGHLLGLDDYYDYDVETGSLGGLGGADMMDNTVGDHNAYSKMLLGWVTPTIITKSQTITINSFESSGSCLLIALGGGNSNFSEYLLIDLYSATGLNAAHANQYNTYLYYDYDTKVGASYGVRIYHVSSDIDDPFNDDYWSFTTNNNSKSENALLELVRANGESGYEVLTDEVYDEKYKDYGDSTDLWQAGQKLSSVFPNYARNDNKKVNFDIEIVSVSATQATITITFTA